MNPDSWCGDYKLDETKVNEVNRPNYEIETIAWTNRFSGVE
jgi:hypothetical protein